MSRWTVKYAWIPLRAYRYQSTDHPDAMVRALYNGWTNDGWLFREHYELITNISGDKFRRRITNRPMDG